MNQAQPAHAQAETGQWGQFGSIMKQAAHAFIIYSIIQAGLGMLMGQKTAPAGTTGPQQGLAPLWPPSSKLPLNAYMLVTQRPEMDWSRPVMWTWQTQNATLGDWSVDETATLAINLPEGVLARNESLYAHMFVTAGGATPNATAADYDPLRCVRLRQNLIHFRPASDSQSRRNLLESDASKELDPPKKRGALEPHWHPNMTVNLVTDGEALWPEREPPAVRRHVRIAADGRGYLPPLFVNEFWALQDAFVPLNATAPKRQALTVRFYPVSLLKFRLYVQMDEQLRAQQEMLGGSAAELNEMKRALLETNVYLLVLGLVASLLHTLFDFMAFKSDVQFWRQRENARGLSLRSVALQVVFQAIILLYLFDNATSWLVLGSAAAGLAVEIWKLRRAAHVRIVWSGSRRLPSIAISQRFPEGAADLSSETDEYDRQAFRWLSWALYPCLAAYAVYSLAYETHKSWYSYVVNTLVGFVYAFGFVAMTPQLFINYKLKSVAHIPWKAFVFKMLNTVVDDIFSFIIKMPWLHRVAVFRDDLVFVVFLYQWYIYPTDMTRVNEFGQRGSDCGAVCAAESEHEAVSSEVTKTSGTPKSGELRQRRPANSLESKD